MKIHDYWTLPPAEQAAIRAQVLVEGEGNAAGGEAAPSAPPIPRSRLDRTYCVLYARDLLTNLGGENVEDRSDDAVIEDCQLQGFYWTGTGWAPE